MKKEWKGFAIGFIAAALMFSTVIPAVASTVRQLNATYKDIKITLDGTEIIPKDAQGNVVEPFIAGGTTYLPIRAVANALGLDVEWDGTTNTVVLAHKNLDIHNGERYAMDPQDVFEAGGYIELDGVEITYDGENFLVKNGRDDHVIVVAHVVGMKADGTYQFLQAAIFGGPDEIKYAQDLAENGWAVMEQTNMVRPGETLTAAITIFDSVFDTKADVDGDGYYDIIFIIYPQESETSSSFSTDAPESEVYRLKVPE